MLFVFVIRKGVYNNFGAFTLLKQWNGNNNEISFMYSLLISNLPQTATHPKPLMQHHPHNTMTV